MGGRFRGWRVVMSCAIVIMLLPWADEASAASPRVKFSFADAVSEADESYVREGIVLAEDYLRETFDGEIEDNLSVRVRSTAHPDDPWILASASGNNLLIFTGSPAWETLSPALRMQVVIHEYVHIYQTDMLGYGRDVSPMWFIEGMAEYVSFNALEELGLIDPEDVDDFQTWAIAYGGPTPDLEDIEDIVDFQKAEGPVYNLAHLAVSELLGDEPEERLSAYLGEVYDGAKWREAFPDAFGVELDEFYAEFDDWLVEEMDSPSRIPTAFRELVGRDREADVAILSGPEELEQGEQAVVVAETERSSNCRFDLRDDESSRLATLETVSDRTGLVFWIVTIPDDAPLGRTSIVADCGGDRDRLRFEVLAA